MTNSDPHVLIVDDNHTNRLLLQQRLMRLGLKVTAASGGREAIELFEEGMFSLVFLDIQMPEVGGFEVLGHIRLADKQVPVVAWTCSIDKNDPYFLEAGFDGELAKPLDTADFFQVIERFLPDYRELATYSQRESEVSALSQELELLSREVVNSALAFRSSIPQRLQEISQAIEDGDLEEGVFLSHKLRGICKLQGYAFLASILKRLESSLELGDEVQAKTQIKILIDGAHKMESSKLPVQS